MITTNSKKLYNKLKNLRTHGITKNKEFFENSSTLAGGKNTYPDWYMEMQDLGYNYRLTDIQASLRFKVSLKEQVITSKLEKNCKNIITYLNKRNTY